MTSKKCLTGMRRPGYAFAVALALACFAGFVFPQSRISGKVVGVSDGDTITVLTDKRKQIKVRLAGIDAPEKGQPYGDAAKHYLSLQVFSETVRLEGSKVDRYGRLVAKVLLHGEDVGLKVIDNGLAWHFKEYAAEQSKMDRMLYSAAETEARKSKINLWRLPNPTPPWEHRDAQRAGEKSAPNPPYTLTPSPVYSPSAGVIVGNKNSMIYHRPGCRGRDKVAANNRVFFSTAQEAERAGYRAARNC